jgi:phosphoesterase RecJ-like protein
VSVSAQQWAKAVEAIDAPGRIALACHLGPDGDALGSMLALAIALNERGRETVASWGSEPFSVPRQYSFLPRLELLSPPESFPAAPEVMITFDAGSFERLGTLEGNARAARTLIVVDHHVSNESFGTINLIDGQAAASAVLVFELLKKMSIPLDRDIASCLYTGLVTDTGQFQYKNTTPEVHRIAAELVAAGAPQDDIAREVYGTHPVGYLRVAAASLARIQVRDDVGMVWTSITQQDLKEHGVDLEDVEALIDLVRTVDVADVAVILKEQPDGSFKVSMRSKGANDVGAICTALGGGGHRLAAGFTSRNGDVASTIEEIASALPR